MSKKMVKTLSVILMAIMMLGIMAIPVSANTLDPKMFDNTSDSTQLTAKTTSIAASIVSVVRVVGIAIAVIMLIVVAIKYITAAPSDKAEVKKHLLIYVIGAVILFAGSTLLGFIQGLSTSWFGASTSASPSTSTSTPGKPGGIIPNPDKLSG